MVWMVLTELVPDARSGMRTGGVAAILGGAAAAMIVLQIYVLA